MTEDERKERRKATQAKYRREHPEKLAEAKKRYRERRKKEIRAKDRERYKRERPERLRRASRWYYDHQDDVAEKHALNSTGRVVEIVDPVTGQGIGAYRMVRNKSFRNTEWWKLLAEEGGGAESKNLSVHERWMRERGAPPVPDSFWGRGK